MNNNKKRDQLKVKKAKLNKAKIIENSCISDNLHNSIENNEARIGNSKDLENSERISNKQNSQKIKKKKPKKIREGCWSKETIQRSIDDLEEKLQIESHTLSKSKRRRIIMRLSKLKRGLRGEIEIGGQIQKSIKTIRKEMESKNTNSSNSQRKNSNIVCLCCRKKGHQMIDCRHYKSNNSNINQDIQNNSKNNYICFSCGERGHTLKDCKKPRTDNSTLPFANCFKCGESGHIVAYCPNNESGSIYPKGGKCNICGSVKHLARNCINTTNLNKNKKIERFSSREDQLNKDDPDLMWKNVMK